MLFRRDETKQGNTKYFPKEKKPYFGNGAVQSFLLVAAGRESPHAVGGTAHLLFLLLESKISIS
jgi:hypothetical protein